MGLQGGHNLSILSGVVTQTLGGVGAYDIWSDMGIGIPHKVYLGSAINPTIDLWQICTLFPPTIPTGLIPYKIKEYIIIIGNNRIMPNITING